MNDYQEPPMPLLFPLWERCREEGIPVPDGLKGRPCWLLFHALAHAPTCREDLQAVQQQATALGHPEVALVAVSVDAADHAREFHRIIGAEALLAWADPELRLARLCGLARNDGVCERASVLVDAEGRVRQVAVHPFCFPRPLADLQGWLPLLQGAAP